MSKYQTFEPHFDLISYSLENYDFTLIPLIGIETLYDLLKDSLSDLLLVTSDLSLVSSIKSKYSDDVNIKTYDEFLIDILEQSVSQRNKIKNNFIILDDVDDGHLKVDILWAVLSKFKIQGRIIIPSKSRIKLETITKFIKSLEYTLNTIDLIESPRIEFYYQLNNSKKSDLLSDVHKTLNTILETNISNTNKFDICVVLPSEHHISQMSSLISSFPLIVNVTTVIGYENFTNSSALRRIIFTTNCKSFLNIFTDLQYIVDCGLITKRRTLQNGVVYDTIVYTDHTRIHQNSSILNVPNSKYFITCSKSSIFNDDIEIPKNHFPMELLYLLKFSTKLDEFKFLNAPNEKNVIQSLSYLTYLGLIQIDNSTISLTNLGDRLIQNVTGLDLSNLSLELAFFYSGKGQFNCFNEFVKIKSILDVLNWNKLSLFIKKTIVTKPMERESDFIEIINIFDNIIQNGELVKRKTVLSNQFDSQFGYNKKVKILQRFKHLRSSEGYDSYGQKSDLNDDALIDSINKALFCGFQLHVATIIDKSTSNQFILKPVVSNCPDDLNLVISTNDLLTYNYSKGDVIIYSNSKYCPSIAIAKQSNSAKLFLWQFYINVALFNFTNKKYVIVNTVSRDIDQHYINLSGKIPKRIVDEVGLALFKLG